MFLWRNKKNIGTFSLKKHLIQNYEHCHIFFHKYHISLICKCLTCIYKRLSGSVVELLPLGLEIVDSVFKQDITKTSESGISCTCLGAQHLEEELGLVVLVSV